MKLIPDNTLAHYEQMPQTKLVDLSAINCNQFGANIKAYREALAPGSTGYDGENYEKGLMQPDSEAVQFYLFNHLAALIRNKYTRNEVLPDWARDVLREYKRVMAFQGIRLTSYMGLITCRESRHLHGKDDSWWQEHIIEAYGKEQKTFHMEIHGSGSTAAANALMNSPPDTPVGHFFKAIETMFYKGSFSGGYGGKPWGDITKCLTEFLLGKTTQEMMIDTAYTLAHNNGPMFNKGMLYSGYTPFFKHLLDVQRSGQIPEMCFETGHSYTSKNWLTQAQKVLLGKVKDAMPEEFGKYVDWYKVQSAGALLNCSVYQKEQDKKYGKMKFKPEKGSWKTPMETTGYFALGNGIEIPIMKRVAA